MAGLKWWKVLLLVLSVSLLVTHTVEAKREKPQPSKTGRLDPKDARPTSAKSQKLLNGALESLQEGDYDGALTDLAELAEQKKVNDYEKGKILQLKAQIADDQDDPALAIQYLEQVVQLNSLTNAEHFQSMLIISQLYSQQEDFQKSVEWFDRWVLDANEVPGNYWMLQAQNYYYMDQFEQAIAYVDRAFATGDEPQAAWAQIKANSLYELERFNDAALFAREQKLAHQADSKLRTQFLGLEVSAYIEGENYDQALAVLEDAKAQGWFEKDIQWKQLYQLYFEAEKPALAASTIEEGIASQGLPANAKVYVDLGEAYYMQDKIPQAIEAFSKAAELSPDDGSADMQRGQLLLDSEKPAESKAALTIALSKGKLKMEGSAWYLLCLAENDLNNISAATAACRKASGFPESQSNAQQMLRLMGAK